MRAYESMTRESIVDRVAIAQHPANLQLHMHHGHVVREIGEKQRGRINVLIPGDI